MSKDHVLIGVFGALCGLIALWPHVAVKLLSYGTVKPGAYASSLAKVFRVMGCLGLACAVLALITDR
jgi:hypothetical protein